jgi:hypothetical protein
MTRETGELNIFCDLEHETGAAHGTESRLTLFELQDL